MPGAQGGTPPHQAAAPRLLVLASSSRYRRDLLGRLGLPFVQDAPAIDESLGPDEAIEDYVVRLAIAKARVVALRHPGAIAIGSDQAALCGEAVLGKPGSEDAARRQLARLAGCSVDFLTAVAVLDAPDAVARHALDRTTVVFRQLDAEEISAYVRRELPLDCAGSFKAEGLGIALFDRIRSDDPTALIGLPLIALCGLLRAAGLDPLRANPAV